MQDAGPRAGDEDLFRSWCSGDRRAGHELFTRHFASIRRFFLNKVDHEVEDLVQRTFMACVEGRERFAQKSSFRTYLFGIAHNLVKEHFRARGRGREEFDPELHSVRDGGAGPSTVLGAHEEQRLVLAALRQIPLEHQVLLELYFWEELPAPRIAEIFAVPENTIRTRIRRGKQLLAEQLERLAESRSAQESAIARLDDWGKSLRVVLDPSPDPSAPS